MAQLQRGQITNIEHVKPYLLGGKATTTIVSKKSGARFTFAIRGETPYPTKDESQLPVEAVWYVDVLVGQDNEQAYAPLGVITQRNGSIRYFHARKSRLDRNAPSATALAWSVTNLIIYPSQATLDQLEVWHEGRCARCGRKLSVPRSLRVGLGPECESRSLAESSLSVSGSDDL